MEGKSENYGVIECDKQFTIRPASGSSSPRYAKLVRSETKTWTEVIEEANIPLD